MTDVYAVEDRQSPPYESVFHSRYRIRAELERYRRQLSGNHKSDRYVVKSVDHMKVPMQPDYRRALDTLSTAYADLYSARNSKERCLSYLMPCWAPARYAIMGCDIIDNYGNFLREQVKSCIKSFSELTDIFAGFALGRENSPVLYIETYKPKMAKALFEEQTRPEEVTILDPSDPTDAVGNAAAEIVEGSTDPHECCRHDNPPVRMQNYPRTDYEEFNYVRVWYTS